ncbi:MAG: exosortase C-terminal domain/associated protein EpsI [Bryobacteraceae bacterium]
MAARKGMAGFLKSGPSRVLTVVLVAQAVLIYTLSRGEAAPHMRPLSTFPSDIGGWMVTNEGVIEKEVLDVLRADDVMNRVYTQAGSGESVSFFVAYFKTQRAGQAPHSPKNCLPGSGWVPSESRVVSVPVAGRPEPLEVNRYVVARGGAKSVVMYWYQSRNRVVASEYKAKIYLVLDSIRYHRSDTALVRVVVPANGRGEEAATRTATNFIQTIFDPLRNQLPE